MLPITRRRHWSIPRWSSSTPSRRSVPAVTLRHGTTNPTLLHRGTAGADAFGTAAATDAAAQDGEKDEAADAAGDADDDGFIVVDPGPDFPGGGGASALALRTRVSIFAKDEGEFGERGNREELAYI